MVLKCRFCFSILTFPLSFLSGKLRCSDQRGNEAERRERLPVVFRRSSEDDLHFNGEGLLQALPQLQTDPGSVSDPDHQFSREEGEEKL